MEYKYSASNKLTGQRVSGVATAENVGDLMSRLKSDDLIPLKVQETKKKVKSQISLFSRRVSGKELAVFTRQMAATLSAGLLLTEALETISDDLENKFFQNIIVQVRKDIMSGEDFSSALAKYPNLFSVTYVSIVKSGEATGKLYSTMANLAKYLEDSERLKEKVKNAVRYPLFVFGFAMVVVMVIVLFLIPKFESMFAQSGSQLPLMTRIVVAVSENAMRYSPFIAMGAFGFFMLFMFLLKFPKFRYFVDAAKLRIPIMGKEVIHKALIARYARTMSFLVEGGVGLAKALSITSQVSNHAVMSRAIQDCRERILAGSSLADEMKKQKIFPSLSSKMAAVGEKTGKMSEMFGRTADYYDEELDSSLQKLTTLLEPALIIFIGSIVMVVVLALYMPIFQMSNGIG